MKHYFLFLCVLSFVVVGYGCKGSQKAQGGMENIPYIPPIINDEPAAQQAPANTPPPISREDINRPPQEMPPSNKEPEITNNPPAEPAANSADMLAGYTRNRIWFRIQIGAFKAALSENDPFFKQIAGQEVRVERSPDNYYRYSLGWFNNYQQAESFKNDLKSKGFGNAFLVAFGDDDKRINIPIDKVLEWYLKP